MKKNFPLASSRKMDKMVADYFLFRRFSGLEGAYSARGAAVLLNCPGVRPVSSLNTLIK